MMSTKRKYDDDDDNQTNDSEIDLTKKKSKKKKNVRFDDVTVYYFARSQGFVSVPSQGTVTLGMVPEHSHVEQYSVADFSRLRHALHKSILRERKLLPPSSTMENDTDEDEPLPVDDYYFVQPIATRQRRTLLKQAGLIKIDASEKHELNFIRRSREICGCSCTRDTGGCQLLTCECYLNGIACQIDRLTFPCPCATMICKNQFGRLEFNQNRVRNHFFQTLTRLEAEKEQENFASLDDLSSIACLLSSIISQIEHEEYEVSSALHSLVSSVDDSLKIPQQSSSFPLLIPPLNIETHRIGTISLSTKEHSQRACHNKSSLRRKTMTTTTTTPPTSSMTMISTELS
jgi:hypothetical protein